MKRKRPKKIKCKPGYYLPKNGAICQKVRARSSGGNSLGAAPYIGGALLAGAAGFGALKIAEASGKNKNAPAKTEAPNKGKNAPVKPEAPKQASLTAKEKERQRTKKIIMKETGWSDKEAEVCVNWVEAIKSSKEAALPKESKERQKFKELIMEKGASSKEAEEIIASEEKHQRETIRETIKNRNILISEIMEQTGLSANRAEAYMRMIERSSDKDELPHNKFVKEYNKMRRRQNALNKRARRRGRSEFAPSLFIPGDN